VVRHHKILSEVKSGMDHEASKRFFVKSVNASPDVMFDDRGNVVYTKAGMKFVRDFDKKHPERQIKDRFENAMALRGNPLQDWALLEQFQTVRTGFTERGLSVEDAQTNGEHVNNMLAMATDLRVRAKIIVHDVCETATTDFSKPFVERHDMAETKVRLEKIAAAILFQNEPELFQLWMEYEEKAGWEDHLVKEIDNMEHQVFVSRALEQGLPSYMHPSFVEALHDTMRHRMKSPLFRDIARDVAMKSGGVALLPAPKPD